MATRAETDKAFMDKLRAANVVRGYRTIKTAEAAADKLVEAHGGLPDGPDRAFVDQLRKAKVIDSFKTKEAALAAADRLAELHAVAPKDARERRYLEWLEVASADPRVHNMVISLIRAAEVQEAYSEELWARFRAIVSDPKLMEGFEPETIRVMGGWREVKAIMKVVVDFRIESARVLENVLRGAEVVAATGLTQVADPSRPGRRSISQS